MKFEITTAENGLIFKSIDDEDDSYTPLVYQEVTVGSMSDAFIEMLYDIVEVYGPVTSRYSRERISIQKIHGDKYECSEIDCDICNNFNN